MEHWWDERRWLRRHIAVAPFGIFAATMLLTLHLEQWIWPGPEGWDRAGGLVDLGALFYGMAAIAVERSVRLMFWAWEQHQKVRAQLRAEGEAIGLEKGEAIGFAKGEAAAAERYETRLAKVAEERGIDLAELLPPDDGLPDDSAPRC